MKESEKPNKYLDFARVLNLWYMKVTVISIVADILLSIPERLGELEIRGRIKTIQATILRKSARVLRRVLDIRGGLLSPRPQYKNTSWNWCEKLTKSEIIYFICMSVCVCVCEREREREREREKTKSESYRDERISRDVEKEGIYIEERKIEENAKKKERRKNRRPSPPTKKTHLKAKANLSIKKIKRSCLTWESIYDIEDIYLRDVLWWDG